MNLEVVQLVLFPRFLHPRLPLLPNLLSKHPAALEVFLLLLILSLPPPKVNGQIERLKEVKLNGQNGQIKVNDSESTIKMNSQYGRSKWTDQDELSK